MIYGINTLDKKSFLSFYSTYSSLKLFATVLNNLYKPYFGVFDLGCSNYSVTWVAQIAVPFKILRFVKPCILCVMSPCMLEKSLSLVIH